MALVKTILKNSAQSTVIKFTGSGTDTITLASLVSGNQTLLGTPVPLVDIAGITVSLGGTTNFTVVRNAVEVLVGHGNFAFPSEQFRAVLSEQSSSDIVVTLSGVGTLIVKLNKMQGYSAV